jgi:hypothetical protein
LGISLVADKLMVSQERLSSIELVKHLKKIKREYLEIPSLLGASTDNSSIGARLHIAAHAGYSEARFS